MGQIKDIVHGHVNELLGKEQDLFEERMEICKACGLFKDTAMGPICNPKKYISTVDKETIYNVPGLNRKSGCNCRLEAKTRVPGAHCIVDKW